VELGKFIWPPTGKVVLAVRESQIIAEEELSKTSENGPTTYNEIIESKK